MTSNFWQGAPVAMVVGATMVGVGLASCGAGRPGVVWREPQKAPRVLLNRGAWVELPPLPVGGTLPTIAMDAKGFPVVAWESPRDGGVGSFIAVARAKAK